MTADRLIDALRGIIRAEIRPLFLGSYEYLVQSSSGATVDVAPASSLPLPPMTGVPLASSILAQHTTGASVGQLCRIRFVNGDPARPVVVSLAAPSSDVTVGATGVLRLGPGAARVSLAGGSRQIARDGDAVNILFSPGTLTGVLTPPGGAPAIVGALTLTTAISGILASTSRASA